MQGDKPFGPKAFYQVNLDDLVPQNNYYRRVNTRGLAGANKHVTMAALTYNLKKFMKRPWNRTKVASLSVQIPPIDLRQGLSAFLGLIKRLSDLHYRPNWAF